MNREEYIEKYSRGARGKYWPFIDSPDGECSRTAGCWCPRITVVTPSYNQSQFLEETICSVIGQDYPNLEYIIIDGESTDGSREIIERYSRWIKFWVSEKDDGQADAIHKGFQRATGDILCWLNSDDVFIPGALWQVAKFFAARPAMECAVGGVLWIDGSGQSLWDNWGVPVAKMPGINTRNRLLYWGQYACPQMSTFWRSSAYCRVGGLDTQMQYCMDRDLFIRFAHEKPFGCISYFLSCYRVHVGSKGTNLQNVRSQEDDFIVRKYGKETIGQLRNRMNRAYYASDVFLRKWWLRFTHHVGLWCLPNALRRKGLI